ncbi:MAG: hypothetical protein HOP12_14950 [Candidatus Eisenbacteria bacterium]|uniref:Uncharacterized protein n=1 Tax=Eiseniibacteriota bacterium TaxID=2212470 RepID=A0A849SLX8_UNCEI|nr:hypothetical protein [Candidatus Eisenbacteria bacterium]
MDGTFQPSFPGALLAIGAIAAGAPLFGEGLRALRLSRLFATLDDQPVDARPRGFASVKGRVALESPLFAPLSAEPCAGFVLRIFQATGGQITTIEERRPFRLVSNGVSAHVGTSGMPWRLRETARRELHASEEPSQNLASLLARSPEASWVRRAGATLVLVELSLKPGSECHVVGEVRGMRGGHAVAAELALRTGTDGETTTAFVAADREPDLWIDDSGGSDYLLVSNRDDERPGLPHLKARFLGLVFGPALSGMGLLYLAWAAEQLRAHGRF